MATGQLAVQGGQGAYVDDGHAQQAQQPLAVLVLLARDPHRALAVLGKVLVCGPPLHRHHPA